MTFEQAIQALRNNSMVLLEQIRAKTGNAIGATHPLFAWSFVHGSFIQNHFAVQGGTTAYERCFGVAYSGKLCNFGEAALTAISPGHHRKGNVKFVKMIWVGTSWCIFVKKHQTVGATGLLGWADAERSGRVSLVIWPWTDWNEVGSWT